MEIRTPVLRFKVSRANPYTMGPCFNKKFNVLLRTIEPPAGLEPAALRLKVSCSTD